MGSPDGNKLTVIWEWKLNWNPQKILLELIKKISVIYDDERNINSKKRKNTINNYSFDRKSTKFWVSHENIFQVIGVIIQHLPIYVYGKKKSSPHYHQQVSSVYFDNDDFKCYHERIQKEEGARAVRIRFYDQNEPFNNSQVFFERKIHHISSNGNGPSS